MLRIVTCIAFGWEYYRGYVTVDGAVHPPMESDTPLKEILGHETYVSPVAGDGIRVRVEFGEESDVPADKCPGIVGWEGEMPDLSRSGVEVYRSGAEAMNPRSLAARLRHARDYDNPYAMVPDRKDAPETPMHLLEIVLQDVEPEVVRTVAVPTDIDFLDLSEIVQAAMGWWEGHMHMFKVKGTETTIESDGEPGAMSEETPIDGFIGRSLEYVYDFGDCWVHDLTWRGPAEDRFGGLPYIVEWKGDSPLEDSGGPSGFMSKMEIVNDPSHPSHERIAGWMADMGYPYRRREAEERLREWQRHEPVDHDGDRWSEEGELWLADAGKLAASRMFELAGFDDMLEGLSRDHATIARGIATEIYGSGGFHRLYWNSCDDPLELFEDGFEDLVVDSDDLIDMVSDMDPDELAVLSSRLYRGITDWEWNDYSPCVHRTTVTLSFVYCGDDLNDVIRYTMDPEGTAKRHSVDALVDDHGIPVAFLPRGRMISEVASMLAVEAWKVLGPDYDDEPEGLWFAMVGDSMYCPEWLRTENTLDSMCGCLCLAETLGAVSRKLYRDFSMDHDEDLDYDPDDEWEAPDETEERLRAALETGKAISTDGGRTYRFSAPSDDICTALSVLVLDPYGITDGDSL